jgi:hypothetical protein
VIAGAVAARAVVAVAARSAHANDSGYGRTGVLLSHASLTQRIVSRMFGSATIFGGSTRLLL